MERSERPQQPLQQQQQDPGGLAGLIGRLAAAGRQEGQGLLRGHLEGAGRDGAGAAAAAAEDAAAALLRQPQAHLRAHGLLAARLAGRADLVLPALDDAGVWRQAACFLCQMDLDAAALTQLQQWLDTAAPAQRCYFLTRLGRLPPRPLGAQLFAALLAGGRTADALRLLRHAGALADGEVERLAREHLVEGQGADQRVATWARQAWKALALQRPALALLLLQELLAKVQGSGNEEESPRMPATLYSPIFMPRRAVLALLHGTACTAAAAALLPSEGDHQRRISHFSMALSTFPVNWQLLRWHVIGRNFGWYYARKQVQRLQTGSGGQQEASMLWRAVDRCGPQAAMRCLFWLHRRGVLEPVLQAAASKPEPAGGSQCCLITASTAELARPLLRAAYLAEPSDAAARGRLLVGLAANMLACLLAAGGPLLPPAWLLASAVDCLEQRLEAQEEEEEAKQALQQLRGYLLFTPDHRAALLAPMRAQPLAEARADAYQAVLQGAAPTSAGAVNDLVPWVLRRSKNERGFVRTKVLAALCPDWSRYIWDGGVGGDGRLSVLHLLADEHLPLLEEYLAGALAAPDGDEELQRAVAGVAAQVLRQGVLQPSRAALAGGLRLHADLLRRFCAPAPKRYAAAQAAGEGEDEGEEGPSPASTEEEAGGDWTCGASISWWDPQAALAPALSLETLQASCDAALAAQQLLKTLLPLYAEAGQPRAAAGLLGTLCSAARCGSAAAGDQPSRPAARLAATLRSHSQLEGAVGALLQGCFPGSDWGQLPASAAEFGFLAGPGKGAGAAQGMGRGGAVPGRVFRSVRGRGRGLLGRGSVLASERWGGWGGGTDLQACVEWWLTDPDEDKALQRARDLLCGPGGFNAARKFLWFSLSREWLLSQGTGAAPPTAVWWQERVLSDSRLLQALAIKQVALCRSALHDRRLGAALCAALLREGLLSGKLCGVVPAYDSVVLPELLSRAAPAEGRLEALQDAVRGFTSKGAAHEEGAVQPDTYWEANRQLPTVDRRRWPPAVQALARQLCVEVAGAALAALSSRLTAVCQLVRLQDVTCAGLEPLVGSKELRAACLLASTALPDSQDVLRFLLPRLSTDDATHAGSALHRLAPCLRDTVLLEAAEDMLATVGLRAAAWQQVLTMLAERGTPQALALVFGEMRRPDLGPSMRCGLLKVTAPLCKEEAVVAFWEECAMLQDKEVGCCVINCVSEDVLRQDESVMKWWTQLGLRMLCGAAGDPQLLRSWAAELACCDAFRHVARSHPALLGCLVAGLLEMATTDGEGCEGWEVAVWLLRRLLSNLGSASSRPGVRGLLRAQLQPLLDRAAAEQQQQQQPGGSSGQPSGVTDSSSCPITSLLLLLWDGAGAGSQGLQGGLPSPWHLGCAVAPPLVRLLWLRYCEHLASTLLNLALAPAAAEEWGAALVTALRWGLAAAPSAAHVMALARAVLEAKVCLTRPEERAGAIDETERRQQQQQLVPRFAAAALRAAATLVQPAAGGQGAAGPQHAAGEQGGTPSTDNRPNAASAAALGGALLGAAWLALRENTKKGPASTDGAQGAAPLLLQQQLLGELRSVLGVDAAGPGLLRLLFAQAAHQGSRGWDWDAATTTSSLGELWEALNGTTSVRGVGTACEDLVAPLQRAHRARRARLRH